MRVDVLTILPEMFEAPMSASILGKARQSGALELFVHDLRDWTHDRHRTTDDYPYGGGPGMVMKPEPLFEAHDAIQGLAETRATVIFMTPAGQRLDQPTVRTLSAADRLLFVCGRYEGFDERVMTLADVELSIGDYVLTGGELPAMVVIDAVTRLLPGVLGHSDSAVEESFSDGLLEYAQYTRPPEYRGMKVPEVLTSGDHGRIERWRRLSSIDKTARLRPDLLAHASLTDGEREHVDAYVSTDAREDETDR